MTIRVAILEDDKLLSEGLVATLTRPRRVEILHSSATLESFVEACCATLPQVAVVDLLLTASGSVDDHVPQGLQVPALLAEEAAKRERPEIGGIPCLVLSKAVTRRTVQGAHRAGFKGFLPKEHTDSREVLDAIERVAQGGLYWHHERIAPFRGPEDPLTDLSDQEIRILEIASRPGWTDDAALRATACAEVAISEATFFRRQRSITAKTGTRSLAHAVTVAILDGIIPPSRASGRV